MLQKIYISNIHCTCFLHSKSSY